MQMIEFKKILILLVSLLFVGTNISTAFFLENSSQLDHSEKLNRFIEYKPKKDFLTDKFTIINDLLTSFSPFFDKNLLGSFDEGVHNNTNFDTQEWWYFNGMLDSSSGELNNWSLMVSFNKMRTCDIFFFTLYDAVNSSYGGNEIWWPGAIETKSDEGVNIQFNNSSYVIGRYPHWRLHIEDKNLDEKTIIADLDYHANAKPHWIFANTGLNNTKSPFGHYSILNSTLSGTISIDGKNQSVHGYGYHEHHWFTFLPNNVENFRETHQFNNDQKNESAENKNDQRSNNHNDKEKKYSSLFSLSDGKDSLHLEDFLNVWDWYCIFLDNGWNLFIGNIFQGSLVGKITPDLLWLTADGNSFLNANYFNLKYLETIETDIPSIKIPSKIRINGAILNFLTEKIPKGLIFLNITIENVNICENVWGDPPYTGVFEGACKVKGSLHWGNKLLKLDGRGIAEITRSKKII